MKENRKAHWKNPMRNRFIQTRNPMSGMWILVDRLKARIAGVDWFPFDGIRVKNLMDHFDDSPGDKIGFRYGRQDSE